MVPKGRNKALSREVSESRGGGSERHEPSGTVSDRAKIGTDDAARDGNRRDEQSRADCEKRRARHAARTNGSPRK